MSRKNLTITNIAKRWQRIASLRRRRISFPRISSRNLGKFVIYTNDQKRFEIPIAYISNNIMKELFEMSEQAFGFPSEGPIRLPCDAAFMKYVITLIKRGSAKDIEKALLMYMESSCCSFDVGFHQDLIGQQCLVFAY